MDILFATWAATRATGWGPAKKNKKTKMDTQMQIA
jgi:hypothetical protein